MKLVILIFSLVLAACSSTGTHPATGGTPDPAVVAAQEAELVTAQTELNKQDYKYAKNLYEKFLKNHPSSVYYAAAELGLAKSLAGLEEWSKAAESYRRVIDFTRSFQPAIAAEAYYQISFCYEALGDETRVLAALLDANRLQQHLKDATRSAEIPARLAASYKRMGQDKEAKKYLSQAEDGVKKIRAQSDISKVREDLSHTYYLMGTFSTNQISYETVQGAIDTLELMQIFLLRSIELESPISSKKSLDLLKEAYRDIWNVAKTMPLNKSLDVGAAERERSDRQVDIAAKLLARLTDLDSYQAAEADKIAMIKDLWAYMSEFRSTLSSFISTQGETLPLTPEAQKRHSLKREGVVLEDPQFPNEKFIPKNLPQKTVTPPEPGEDPNLQQR